MFLLGFNFKIYHYLFMGNEEGSDSDYVLQVLKNWRVSLMEKLLLPSN